MGPAYFHESEKQFMWSKTFNRCMTGLEYQGDRCSSRQIDKPYSDELREFKRHSDEFRKRWQRHEEQ